MDIAIIGATGNVGRKTIEILEKSTLSINNLYLVASKNSAGKKISFKSKDILVEELENYDFSKAEITFFAAGSSIAKEWIPAQTKLNLKYNNSTFFLKTHSAICNIEGSHFTDKKFEIITLWHVLEHVENLEEYISTLEKLLTKNGTLIIAAPNYKSYDANYYSKFWAAFDVPRHLWHFSETSISKLFAPVNLKVEKTLPMKFDAYYVSLLSEKYKCGSMKPISALYRGFVSNIKAIKSKQYSSLIYVLKKS